MSEQGTWVGIQYDDTGDIEYVVVFETWGQASDWQMEVGDLKDLRITCLAYNGAPSPGENRLHF